MKFHLFSGLSYYPNGGAMDFKGSFDTLEAAQNSDKLDFKELSDPNNRWAHITNDKFEIVSEFKGGMYDKKTDKYSMGQWS